MDAPTRIGRYEIVRRLGKSMTEVYLAMDTVENRKVALKLIRHGDDRASQLVVEAERRGAAIQKELHSSDPRVVEIYEYGDLDGYFFVAMPFIEGRTVAGIALDFFFFFFFGGGERRRGRMRVTPRPRRRVAALLPRNAGPATKPP